MMTPALRPCKCHTSLRLKMAFGRPKRVPRSAFDAFNSFLRRRRKLIIVAWLIAVILAGTQISIFFSHVSYNVAGSNFGGPSNAESDVAQNVVDAHFPSTV